MREVDAAKESISGELQSCRETIAVLWEECCDLRSLADRERELNREVKQETPSLRHSVEMVLDISATQLEQASEEDLAFCIGQLEYNATRLRAQMSRLQQMQREERLCCVCLDGAKTVLLLPCRHLCVCENCSTAMDSQRRKLLRICPICRVTVEEMMKVFS